MRKHSAGILIVPTMLSFALVGCGRSGITGSAGGGFPAPAAEPDFQYAEEAARDEAFEAEVASGEAFAPGVDGSVNQTSFDSTSASQIERLIIRNGSISIQADDTLAAEQAIDQMVTAMSADGAFVVSREHYGYGGEGDLPNITMVIRVPINRFDESMDRIEGMASEGTTPSRSESGQDVTEEYVDLQARLQSLEAARDRLLDIMRNAQTTEELLLAEEQLTQREAEIESIKGRMQYLSESARLSSITISITPYFAAQPVDARWRPGETVRRAIDSLVDGARDFADFLIFFVIAILPWLVLFGLVIFGFVRLVLWRIRVGRNKRAQKAGASATVE